MSTDRAVRGDRYERRLKAQYAVTRALVEAPTLRQATPAVVQAICTSLDWQVGGIWVRGDNSRLHQVDAWCASGEGFDGFVAMSRDLTFEAGEGLLGDAYGSGEPVWVPDVRTDGRFTRAEAAAAAGLRTALMVPVVAGNETVAVLEFFSCDVRQRDDDVMQMMYEIGREVGQFIGRKRVEDLVVKSEALKTAIIESALDCVITMDHQGRIVEFNPAAERTFGYARTDVVGKEMAELLIPPESRDRHREGLRRCVETGETRILGQRLELEALRSDGSRFPIEATIARVEIEGPPMFTGYIRDISERLRAQEQIVFLAYHDKLTGLPNRARFEELLEMALVRAKRNDLAVAVIYMDLDNFKMINDSLGHGVGDELLTKVAERLTEVSRETDTVARLGGDEFLVLLADLPRGGYDETKAAAVDSPVLVTEAVAARIQDALRRPFPLVETQVYASVSMGISIFPFDADDARTLLKNADAAMYRSKKSGPGGYVIFPSEATDPKNKLSLVTRLRTAVDEQRWVLHYQPVVDLIRSDMIGVEALLRWNDADRGLIYPNDFMSIAEEMGYMESIGEWLLEQLFQQYAEWHEQGLRLVMTFNLSPRQLWHPDLAEKLITRLTGSGMDPSSLVIEMTESAAMADPDRTLQILSTLRGHGLRFAIDDFGTGYSSLSRLRDLPVDILKIDRAFVRDIGNDPDADTMVKAIIQLAHSLGMAALAEGIETEDQRRFLVSEGCLVGQGFHFSKPVPPDEIPALYRRHDLPRLLSEAG